MRKPRRAGRPAMVPEVGTLRARHLQLATRTVATAAGVAAVTVDDAESPLAWLARRKGRDGRPLITAAQFCAGERLRADFTRASLSPRMTANWEAPVSRGNGAGGGSPTETMIAARQRMQTALTVCGPEFAGLLLDVCCFLRRLEEVERARGWPARSAKVVLQLALDRLARHYGLRDDIRGAPSAAIRSWLAEPESGGAASE